MLTYANLKQAYFYPKEHLTTFSKDLMKTLYKIRLEVELKSPDSKYAQSCQ